MSVGAAVWPSRPAAPETARLLAEEAVRIRPAWQGERRILLDRMGDATASEGVAVRLGRLEADGTRTLALLVGGPGGVDPALRAEADGLWSLGPATLPHTLAAVVVLEQLYRGYRILRGVPYHH